MRPRAAALTRKQCSQVLRPHHTLFVPYRPLNNPTRRRFTIKPTPTTSSPDSLPPTTSTQILQTPGASSPSSTFTTHGPSSTLLTITLAPSQPLQTRRSALLALSGPPSHISSTLSPLELLQRVPLALPFIYQRLSSISPATLVLAARTANTSFTILSLDGRIDWNVLPRSAIVAWASDASTLAIQSRFTPSVTGITNWSSQLITGRGLVALAARGGAYETRLADGEEFLASPGSVVAYSTGPNAPEAFRLGSQTRLAVLDLRRLLPKTEFIRAVKESVTWRFLGRVAFVVRRWIGSVVWGERVYLRFRGPGTVILRGKVGAGIKDWYEDREVNEWADSSAGTIEKSVSLAARAQRDRADGLGAVASSTKSDGRNVNYATVGNDGKVAWAKE